MGVNVRKIGDGAATGVMLTLRMNLPIISAGPIMVVENDQILTQVMVGSLGGRAVARCSANVVAPYEAHHHALTIVITCAEIGEIEVPLSFETQIEQ